MNGKEKSDIATDTLSAARRAELIAALETFDDEFVALLEEDRCAARPLQDRESL